METNLEEVYGKVICEDFSEEDLLAVDQIIKCFLSKKELNIKSLRYPIRLLAIMILAEMNIGIEYTIVEATEEELKQSNHHKITTTKNILYGVVRKYLGFRPKTFDTVEKVIDRIKYINFSDKRFSSGIIYVFDRMFFVACAQSIFSSNIIRNSTYFHFKFNYRAVEFMEEKFESKQQQN